VKQPIEFGDYYLFERIAVGGMAEVFKAASYGVEGFERVVALKRVLPQISEDQAFIDMFIDEAKIAVQLDHPNISRIYDLGNAESSYFIAMEYVPGHDARALFDRARSTGRHLDIALCCHIVKEVCEALEYAHTKANTLGEPLSLIHRDVSPQNILLSYDGQVKLIDFGIAKAAGKATKTQSGILKGKFGYMSPEHVRGRPIDHRSDIFALAVVLYELLTSERCFRGKDDFSTLEKVRRIDYRSVRELNRSVPPELERIVVKGLAKSPKARFQSAAEFQDALQTFLYQTGSFVSRKNLSGLMSQVFEAEIKKERASINAFRQYARKHIPAARRASSLDDLIAGSAIKMAPTQKLIPKSEQRAERPQSPNALLDYEGKPTDSMSGPKETPQRRAEPSDRATLRTPGATNHSRSVSRNYYPNAHRQRWITWLLGLLLLIGLGVLFARTRVLEPGQINITSDPADVVIYVDSEKVFEGKTPVTLNNIAANERYFISLTAPGFDPQERRVMLQAGESRQLRIAMMPSAGQTNLTLSTIPSGAEVFLDDKSLGKTPLNLKGLPSGKRQFQYRLDGIIVKTEELKLSLGEAVIHEVLLPPPSIDVTVRTVPHKNVALSIRVDAQPETRLKPDERTFSVANDGRSELVVRAPGYESEIRKLKSIQNSLSLLIKLTPSAQTLERQRSTTKRRVRRTPSPLRGLEVKREQQANIILPPPTLEVLAPGFVSVHSFPAADCFIDGRPVGMTPVYRQKVPSGVHAIMLKRSTQPEFTKIIRVTVKPEDEEKLVYKHPK
jgi:serine/threonine protein kinase